MHENVYSLAEHSRKSFFLSCPCLTSNVPTPVLYLCSLSPVSCPLSPVSRLCSLSPIRCRQSYVSVDCSLSLFLCTLSQVICHLSPVLFSPSSNPVTLSLFLWLYSYVPVLCSCVSRPLFLRLLSSVPGLSYLRECEYSMPWQDTVNAYTYSRRFRC